VLKSGGFVQRCYLAHGTIIAEHNPLAGLFDSQPAGQWLFKICTVEQASIRQI
jgi:hypothetical protein